MSRRSVSSERSSSSFNSHDRDKEKNGDSKRGKKTSNVYDDSITKVNDPELLKARIFIGNLNTKATSKESLLDLFEKHGKILGFAMLKGFAFVQYENASSAQEACKEKGRVWMGSKIDVKMATVQHKRSHEPFDEPIRKRQRFGRGRGGRGGGSDGFRSEDFYDGNDELSVHATRQSKLIKPPFDCQVILMSCPQIRDYGSLLESRLTDFNIVTNVERVVTDADVKAIVEDAAKRAIPFAIVANEDNVSHKSITVNILHGTPQEHRNMPFDDAMRLVSRSFTKYLQNMRDAALSSNPSDLPKIPQEMIEPDEHTLYLLNLLADRRILTLDELDKVLEYLARRRKRLLELGQGRRVSETPDNSVPVQDPILDVIGKESREIPDIPAAADISSLSSSLADPSVQQALNNLLTSGALNNTESKNHRRDYQEPSSYNFEGMNRPENLESYNSRYQRRSDEYSRNSSSSTIGSPGFGGAMLQTVNHPSAAAIHHDEW